MRIWLRISTDGADWDSAADSPLHTGQRTSDAIDVTSAARVGWVERWNPTTRAPMATITSRAHGAQRLARLTPQPVTLLMNPSTSPTVIPPTYLATTVPRGSTRKDSGMPVTPKAISADGSSTAGQVARCDLR